MIVCDFCPFTTEAETLTARPQCKRPVMHAPSPEEIAQATAKVQAGSSRCKRTLRCAYLKNSAQAQQVKE